MSDDPKPAAPKKAGKLKKMVIIGGGALLLLGGGAAAGMYASGFGQTKHAGEEEDPDKPKLVLKEGEHGPLSVPRGREDQPLADPGRYKASYYNIEQNFTSNLRDTDGFAQVSLGVSTFYDQRVIDRLKEHQMPIRSAVLMVLADQSSEVLDTPEGKKALQKHLKVAVNDVLKAKTGFGGVDDVYFTNFIIQ